MKLTFKIDGHAQEIEFTSLKKAIAKAQSLGYSHYYNGTALLPLEFYFSLHQNDTKYVGGSQTKYCIAETKLGHSIGVCENPNKKENFAIGFNGLYV